jgi:DNA-binding MarR family transcriptional regulator
MSSPLSATFSLLRASRLVASALELRMMAATGLSLTAGELLARLAISRPDQLGVVELASATGLSRSGVSRVLDRLEERQLILRRISETDRRLVVVGLTGAGADLLQNVLATFEFSAETDIARGLTSEELDWLQIRIEKIAIRSVADEQVERRSVDTA